MAESHNWSQVATFFDNTRDIGELSSIFSKESFPPPHNTEKFYKIWPFPGFLQKRPDFHSLFTFKTGQEKDRNKEYRTEK